MIKTKLQFIFLACFLVSVLPATVLAQEAAGDRRASRLTRPFEVHHRGLKGLSYAELKAMHEQTYAERIGFDVEKADFYKEFIEAFGISEPARKKLGDLGFVVLPAPGLRAELEFAWEHEEDFIEPIIAVGPSDVFYRVFASDLPVFVSADAVAHAWHRTFEAILMEVEVSFLMSALGELLETSIAEMDASKQDERDAMFYLSVAHALSEAWDGNYEEIELDPAVRKDVLRFVEFVENKQPRRVNFMGVPTNLDFSQFIPRGHYTESEAMTQYFLSMTWLGQVDLTLRPGAGDETPRPREEAAARAIARILRDTEMIDTYQQINRFYGIVVGETGATTPIELIEICGDKLDRRVDGRYATVALPAYSSRPFESDAPPVSMRFFPKRFAVDAWITARATTPELKPNVIGGRAMATPFDVAFGLGSDRALLHLDADMKKPLRENLPATLEALRRTMESVRPTDVEDTVYNHWLEALMALAEPTVDRKLPSTMRTAVWHDRKLEVLLSSWSELRHDTVLAVEQSVGGSGCQYPRGYVEPVPEFYRSLARAASRMRQSISAEAADGVWGLLDQDDHEGIFTRWEKTMATLASLAEKERRSQPMNDADLKFLNDTVDLHVSHGRGGYGGGRSYDGWYPGLFHREQGEESHPVIADVHTDADASTVLQTGVGHMGLIVVAIKDGNDISLYGGPAYNYYSFENPAENRLTDEQWNEILVSKTPPKKPGFTETYWQLDNHTKRPKDKRGAREPHPDEEMGLFD